MRLAKYLAHAGVASRRAAEQLVFGGRVRVDGEEVRDPARDVGDGNAVTVDGADVRPAGAGDLVVYALHKPKGVVSTARDPQRRRTVVSLVRSPHRRSPLRRAMLPEHAARSALRDAERSLHMIDAQAAASGA